MSLFNFNPSSFLGSGAFKLDPSKFNFSNITVPKPVDDPVAIVSDKTPDAEVEILEGAGTVAVTEKAPDPIEEAIKTVVKPTPVETAVTGGYKPTTPVAPQPEVIIPEITAPVDLGMDFGLGDAQASTDNLPTSFIGDASLQTGFNAGNTKDTLTTKTERDTENLIKNLALETESPFDVDALNKAKDSMDGASFTNYLNQIVSTPEYSNFIENSLSSIEDQAGFASRLNNVAIDDVSTQAILNQKLLLPSYFTGDGTVKLQEDGTYKFIPKVDDPLVSLAVGVGMAAMTGGIASSIGAIAGGAGATAGTAKAIGNVVANIVVQGVTTGSVGPKDLAVAAINGYADGVQQAVKTGEVTKELAAQADLIKDISTSVDLVKAVEDKDVLGAISSGLELADLESPATYVKDTLGTTDAQTKGILKVADKQLQGENLEDSIKSGLTEWVKEGGLSEIELSGSFELPDINIEIPEELKEIGDALANGASELNRNVIKPLVKTVEGIGTQIKDTYKEEIEPYIEREFDDFKDYYKTEIEPSIEQGIKDVKQELADFDDNTLQPAKDTIIETAENIENYYKTEIEPSIEQGIKDVKEELARFDENVLQPIKNTAEQVLESVDEKLGQFDDEVLQPIKDDIIAVAESVDQGLSDFNKDVIKPAMQSIEDRLSAIDMDTSDLEKMIKGLFEMVNFGNVANQTMQRVANRPTFEQVDLTNVELLTPEVVEGFEYDNLSNKLLA